MSSDLWINLMLVSTTVLFAFLCLVARQLFTSVVFFISFGLLVSLCWVKLGAIDLAIVEAVIGAGITGALSLIALKSMKLAESAGQGGELPQTRGAFSWLSHNSKALYVGWLTLLAILVGAVLVHQVVTDFDKANGLFVFTQGSLENTGVTNPVTAVLVNYRAYDTLLEMAVFLLALIVVRSSNSQLPVAGFGVTPTGPLQTPLLRNLVQYMVPLAILMGGYLLWIGSSQPGGAFQAGALLAGAGLMVLLTGDALDGPLRHPVVPVLAGIGLLVFLAVACLMLIWQGSLLQYPVAQAGSWILLIEFFATVSVAVILLQLMNAHVDTPGREVAGS